MITLERLQQVKVMTTGCLLDYPYFKKYSKLIVRDLSKNKN